MTNIQRQEATLAKLLAVMQRPYNGATNMTLNTLRRAHVAAMVKVGYTAAEARDSAQECNDVARMQEMAL